MPGYGGPFVISGCIGPRGDGYAPDLQMAPDEAEAYHCHQVGAFAGTETDMVTAVTMTHTGEALGLARAAERAGLPVVISFTLETDGRLPSGQPLGEAIQEVDEETGRAPAYYMINCAHPEHFADVLEDDGSGWTTRIRGLRANASRKSHAELDESETLDDGDPDELGRDYALLVARLPSLSVYGGCCGTDHRHISADRPPLLPLGCALGKHQFKAIRQLWRPPPVPAAGALLPRGPRKRSVAGL